MNANAAKELTEQNKHKLDEWDSKIKAEKEAKEQAQSIEKETKYQEQLKYLIDTIQVRAKGGYAQLEMEYDSRWFQPYGNEKRLASELQAMGYSVDYGSKGSECWSEFSGYYPCTASYFAVRW